VADAGKSVLPDEGLHCRRNECPEDEIRAGGQEILRGVPEHEFDFCEFIISEFIGMIVTAATIVIVMMVLIAPTVMIVMMVLIASAAACRFGVIISSEIEDYMLLTLRVQEYRGEHSDRYGY